MPDGFKIKSRKFRIPKIGWGRIHLDSRNSHADRILETVTVKNGKWYAVICFEIDTHETQNNGVVGGADRNAQGQIAITWSDDTSDDVIESSAGRVL